MNRVEEETRLRTALALEDLRQAASLFFQQSRPVQANSIALSQQATLACRRFSKSKSLPKCACLRSLRLGPFADQRIISAGASIRDLGDAACDEDCKVRNQFFLRCPFLLLRSADLCAFIVQRGRDTTSVSVASAPSASASRKSQYPSTAGTIEGEGEGRGATPSRYWPGLMRRALTTCTAGTERRCETETSDEEHAWTASAAAGAEGGNVSEETE